MNIRQEQRARTRQVILDTAARVFANRGIGATRTADVAEAAGLSHGALFTHFPTRDDLVLAVVEAFSASFRAGFDARLDQNFTVRDVLAAHLAQIEREEALYARLASEGPLLTSPARAAWLNVLTTLSLRLGEAVERLPSETPLRTMPLFLVFNTWIGLLHHHLAYRDLYAQDGALVATRGCALLTFMTGLFAQERMES